MLDALLDDLDGLASDGALLLFVLVLSGGGLAAVAASGLVQGRQDVRRRAAAGSAAAQPAAKNGRAQAQAALDRLAASLGALVTGGNERENKKLRVLLTQAGFFDNRALPLFFAARFAGAALGGVLALLALPLLLGEMAAANFAAGVGALAILGYFLPSVLLGRRVKARQQMNRDGFPDFMDLMVVCAEAGLSMEAAVDRIARELVESCPPLAENLYIASLEMRAGKGFTESLERLAERLGLDEARMLATLLAQSVELGTSLSQSLRVYSDEMRHKRMSRAEEKAYALPAKLVVPLMLFVFPVLLVTLTLPAAVRVMEITK